MTLDEAWARLLASARVVDASARWPRFNGAVSEEAGGGWSIALDETYDVRLSATGVAALRDVAAALEDRLAAGIERHDLERELLREVGRVVREGRDEGAAALADRLATYTNQAVVAVPVGGVYSSAETPLRIGDAVVGHVSRETEAALRTLARDHGLDDFRFTDEAWWTEDYLAAEEDGQYAAELAEEEEENGTWQPLVVCIAVPAAGTIAAYEAMRRVRAFLGLVVLVEKPGTWAEPWPWLLGEFGTPRSPTHGVDADATIAVLQVDALPGRRRAAASEDFMRVAGDVDVVPLVSDSSVARVADAILNRGADTALSRACRLALAASRDRGDAALVLLTAALDALGADASSVDGTPFERSQILRARLADTVRVGGPRQR